MWYKFKDWLDNWKVYLLFMGLYLVDRFDVLMSKFRKNG